MILGAAIQSANLCVIKNLYTTIRCKNCGKPRSVFVLGGLRIQEADRNEVNSFLQDQSQTYTCGTDFSELAASVKTSKKYLRPYCQTYSGLLTLSCLHPVDEKVYKLDQHKTTCSQCGDHSLNPTVENQFPLCSPCKEKGWKLKAFTVISKRVYGKRMKKNDTVEVRDEEECDVREINANVNDENGNNQNDNEDDFNDINEDIDREGNEGEDEDKEAEEEDTDVNNLDDENAATITVDTDLVSGSKKRGKISKKTVDNTLICNSDIDFMLMHGSGEFSSLSCNDFSNKELLKKLENRAHYNSKKN